MSPSKKKVLKPKEVSLDSAPKEETPSIELPKDENRLFNVDDVVGTSTIADLSVPSEDEEEEVKSNNSEFLQIQILVNVLLTSGYQPSLTKFLEDVTYFSKLNLPFLPQITNEKISNICFVVVRILLYMFKYITHFPYPLHKMTTSIGFPYLYHKVIPNVQHVGNGRRQ